MYLNSLNCKALGHTVCYVQYIPCFYDRWRCLSKKNRVLCQEGLCLQALENDSRTYVCICLSVCLFYCFTSVPLFSPFGSFRKCWPIAMKLGGVFRLSGDPRCNVSGVIRPCTIFFYILFPWKWQIIIHPLEYLLKPLRRVRGRGISRSLRKGKKR